MCVFSSPSPPPPVQVPTPPNPVKEVAAPSPAAQEQDAAVQQARTDDRQKRLRAAQANDTLVTGGGGLVDQPATGLKNAFGA